MKKLLLLATYTIAGCISLYSAEQEKGMFELQGGELLRLDYNPNSKAEEVIKKLYLNSNDKEDVVSSMQAKNQICSIGTHGQTPYESCSIVAAEHKSNKLLVLYAFKNGRQQIVRADHSQRGYATPFKLDEDLLLVLYFKDQNLWKTEISVYIQTVWGDIIGENISGLSLVGDQSFEIKFNRKWKIEGSKSAISDNREKVLIPDKQEVKKLFFDDKSKIIFWTNDRGDKFFTQGTVWWIGENKDHIEEMRVRWDARMRAESEARGKGTELPAEKISLVEVLMSKNIALMDLQYFPETNDHQGPIKITRDLREEQSKQKTEIQTEGADDPKKPNN